MHFIDIYTQKNLKTDLILELIHPFSTLGKIRKQNYTPFTTGNEQQLRDEYSKIKTLMNRLEKDPTLIMSLSLYLQNIDNITSLIAGLSEDAAVIRRALEIDELYDIKRFIFYYEKLRKLFLSQESSPIIPLKSLEALFKLLDPQGLETAVFNLHSSYSQTLSSLKQKRHQLILQIKTTEHQLLDEVKNRFSFTEADKVMVVSRNNKDLLAKLNDSSLFVILDENFANVTFSLRKSEQQVILEREEQELKNKIEEEELKIRGNITALISLEKKNLLKALADIAKLDLLIAKAVFANEHNSVIPEINFYSKGDRMQSNLFFKQAVNLPVQMSLHEQDIDYQPIDINIDSKVNILTGTNMSGKSTLIETIGQMLYLTCYAIPLPCSEAVVSLVDFIYSSRSSETEGRTDLSSFASELVSLNTIISDNINSRGLFLIDEFARGTNPYEGEAFSLALMEFFFYSHTRHNAADIVIAATHFSSPLTLKGATLYTIPGINNEDYLKLKNTVNQPLRKDKTDLANRLHELHRYMNYQPKKVDLSEKAPHTAVLIAELLGVNDELISKVKTILQQSSNNNHLTKTNREK